MQSIQLDISRPGDISPIVCKQGDVGRKFLVTLTEEGEPFDIPVGSVLSAWYSGTGGAGNYTDIDGKSPFTIIANTVTVELVAQLTAAYGGGMLCLVINDADGNQLGLWNIPYLVEKIPGSDSQGAKDFYSAFSRAAADFMTDTTLSIPGRAADAAAVGKAIAGGAASLEVLDAGAIGNESDLSQLVIDQAEQMTNPGVRLLSVKCDFSTGSGALVLLYRGESTDSCNEAFAILIDTYGNIMMGTTYNEGDNAQWQPVSWTTLLSK